MSSKMWTFVIVIAALVVYDKFVRGAFTTFS